MIALKPENVVDVLFGNRLRQLLDERNISQAHFADRIGVSRSRMNNYVAQRSEPDYATLIRIANTLDTTIDFLLGKSEHQGLPQTACLSTMERQSGLAQTGKEIPADCKTGSPDGN